MKTRILSALLAFLMIFSVFSMSACEYIDFSGIVGEKGEPGEPGQDGKDGIDGENGKDGKDGVDGEDGKDGTDGITPLLRINEETELWEVSYDNGLTWTSMGVKATGENGKDGADGKDGVDGENGKDGVDGKDGIDGEDGFSMSEEQIKNMIDEALSQSLDKSYSNFAKSLISQWQYQMYNNNITVDENTVDIILFAGQSNMCGRAKLTDKENLGIVYDVKIEDAFTYNSNAERVKITEPITANGTSDYGLVPSFLNAYHETTGRKVCACFQSVGGVMLNKFLPYTYDADGNQTYTPTSYYKSMVSKIGKAKSNLEKDGYEIGNIYLVWLQGESDAYYYGYENKYANSIEVNLTEFEDQVDYYYENFSNLLGSLKEDTELDKAFIIRIGHRNTANDMTNACIIEAQNRLGKENDDCILVSTILAGAKVYTRPGESTAVNLMRDSSHYLLEMYNYAGIEAGINAGIYVNSGHCSKPILYEYNNDYLKAIGQYEKVSIDFDLENYLYIPNKNGFNDYRDYISNENP